MAKQVTVCHVIGCGNTAAMFEDVQDKGYVIGVNDAGKFGYYFNELLFLNRPRHFNELDVYGRPRLETIKQTNFGSIICLSTLRNEWMEVFPEQAVVSLPPLTRWAGSYKLMTCYHTNNSPFTAMSYAALLGFTEIVLWGVDFINHRHLKAHETVSAFSEFALAKHSIKIYKGHHSSLLNLPVWKSQQ